MRQGSTLDDKVSTLPSPSGARVVRIIWVVATVLAFFAAENLWLDPWLRSKSRSLPSLTPDALSGPWFLALLVVTVFCILLIVAQVLVALDRGVPLGKRVGTGMATVVALLLCVLWACVTGGMTSPAAFWQKFTQRTKGHTVTLTWNASKSAVRGYNVYRGTKSGLYEKVNQDVVHGLTYKDENVPGRTTYYYVARSVDFSGRESVNSSEIAVTVP